jgi:mono/diheme cytochrome c family protein
MYAATCGGCHGVGVGPHILGQGLPEAYIRYVARNGLRAMPAFRPTDFTDAELASLATWINAQPPVRAAAASAPAPMAPAPTAPAQRPAGGAGASRGETVYSTTCSGCHDGGNAPPLRGHALPEGFVEVVVRHGRRQMPAFPETSISNADLAALVAWLNAQPRRTQ